jgi:hypothetical protein
MGVVQRGDDGDRHCGFELLDLTKVAFRDELAGGEFRERVVAFGVRGAGQHVSTRPIQANQSTLRPPPARPPSSIGFAKR